jgi:mercuric ion transport protein
VGLGFLLETVYLLPLTVFFLALAVAALGFRARRRRGYGPLVVGVVAAGAMVLGKFSLEADVAVYGGVAALIGASLWNSWPVKTKPGVPPAPTGTLYQIGSIQKEK